MTSFPLETFGLTNKQARLIRLSINISRRAKRAENIFCRQFLAKWYCHAGSAAITIEKFDPVLLRGEEGLKNIHRFLKANPLCYGTQTIRNYPNQLNRIIKGIQSIINQPAVFHVCHYDGKTYNSLHTFIVLGTYKGKLWVFEKIAKSEDFRITTFENAVSDYPGELICYSRLLNIP